MIEDTELLRRYADGKSEDAFAELVQRRIGLVYSVARRHTHDPHRAEDVTQAVFTALARKAGELSQRPVLVGWLYRSAQFAASDAVRAEARRQAREQEAHLMQEIEHEAAEPDWAKLRPVLDEVLNDMDDRDRDAVLLRFFDGRGFAEVGAKLRLTENAARMRVERALERMRALLARRGVTSTAAALGLALANQAGMTAPAGLAASVTGAVFAGGGVAAGAAAVTTMGFMSMTKLQLGLTSALAVAGATGFVVQADTTAKLRNEAAALRQENSAIASLETEILRLRRLAVEVGELRRDDAEFARLQQEASELKTRLQQIARAEEARTAAQGIDKSKLDRTPLAKFQLRPRYPETLRNVGVSGEVLVDFIVDSNGDVQKAYVRQSSQREFEAVALEAVNTWKFDAGRKGGREVSTHMQVPIVFTVVGGAPAAVQDPKKDEKLPPGVVVRLSPFDVHVNLEPKEGEKKPTGGN